MLLHKRLLFALSPTSWGNCTAIRSFRLYSTSSQSGGPLKEYDRLVKQGTIRDDSHQRIALQKLQDLHDSLVHYKPPTIKEEDKSTLPKWMTKFLPQSAPVEVHAPRGVYMYGDVGCGKTFLMDMFYNTTNHSGKRRIHFHHFMHDVHSRIHSWRKTKRPDESDPIAPLASELVKEAWLLCFDEFQVNDVADAMILHRLFGKMLKHGAVLVATSNRKPDGRDYRLSGAKSRRVYLTPITPENDAKLDKLFSELTGGLDPVSETLSVLGRALYVPKQAKGVAMFDFKDLCGKPLGAFDYMSLCKHYHTFVIHGIPKLVISLRNEARRFITLIDVLYDCRAKLLCTAAETPQKLLDLDDNLTDMSLIDDFINNKLSAEQQKVFTGDEEKFMFARAASRLTEMQSDLYLATAFMPPSHKDQHDAATTDASTTPKAA